MRLLLALLLVVVTYFADLSAVFGYEIPGFTSCVNPQGQIKANYETGTHGIVGSNATYEGKDTVYSLSDNSLTQCFCAADGKGIQTNWWKAPALTESELNTLKSQDWIYIPNGALWGLENAPYLAKNSDFSCKSSGGGNGSGGTSDSNNNSGSSGSSGSSSGSSSSGGVGQVLGLASTGNSVFMLGVALTSGLSLVLGLFLKKRTTKYSK